MNHGVPLFALCSSNRKHTLAPASSAYPHQCGPVLQRRLFLFVQNRSPAAKARPYVAVTFLTKEDLTSPPFPAGLDLLDLSDHRNYLQKERAKQGQIAISVGVNGRRQKPIYGFKSHILWKDDKGRSEVTCGKPMYMVPSLVVFDVLRYNMDSVVKGGSTKNPILNNFTVLERSSTQHFCLILIAKLLNLLEACFAT
uniref:DDE_Tnp_1 domain-containing protein n=1 Tax=Steinernema glaseri TaxID=37863 RepID=A0A1I8AHE2_9BILA